MTKIVYNACYGGFGLSHEAVMRYAKLKGLTLYPKKQFSFYSYYTVPVEEYKKVAEHCDKTKIYTELSDLYFSPCDIQRDDPILVQVVEELGTEACGNYARLEIMEVPSGTRYKIDEYDGNESIETEEDVGG